MEYRGFVAVVEFDDSTDVLHGRAVNGGPYPVATFEATHTRAPPRVRAFRRRVPRVVRGGLRRAAEGDVRRD